MSLAGELVETTSGRLSGIGLALTFQLHLWQLKQTEASPQSATNAIT